MPDEHPFTLRQVDPARADFAAIESDLEAILRAARPHLDADAVGAHGVGHNVLHYRVGPSRDGGYSGGTARESS
jgi:hypothetical protein